MLTKKEIIKNLKKIKIREKYIIIHSDITGLIFNNFSIKQLWKIIFETFGKKKVYIFPTFTFSNKNKIWNYSSTKSETGILSEFFRKKISIKRTIHPIHSVAIFGKNNCKNLNHNSASSFGKGSIWEWLCNSKDVCNISLGLNLKGGATFCHFSEEKTNVRYRKYKDLDFKIIGKDKKIINKKFTYFARNSKFKRLKNDWSKVEKDLIKHKMIEEFIFPENNYRVIKMNTHKVTNFLLNRLKKNSNYLIKN